MTLRAYLSLRWFFDAWSSLTREQTRRRRTWHEMGDAAQIIAWANAHIALYRLTPTTRHQIKGDCQLSFATKTVRIDTTQITNDMLLGVGIPNAHKTTQLGHVNCRCHD